MLIACRNIQDYSSRDMFSCFPFIYFKLFEEDILRFTNVDEHNYGDTQILYFSLNLTELLSLDSFRSIS